MFAGIPTGVGALTALTATRTAQKAAFMAARGYGVGAKPTPEDEAAFEREIAEKERDRRSHEFALELTLGVLLIVLVVLFVIFAS